MKTLIQFLVNRKLFKIILIFFLCISFNANAQYFTNYYSNAGNPGTLNTEGDQATIGWTSINTLGTTNSWSNAQTIPFYFQFYGTTVTGFKASMNGLLTFTTTTTGTPPNANSPLPAFGMPNKTIVCFWDQYAPNPPGGGGTDQVVIKTFGTSPNRQLWIKWFSVEIGANSNNTWAYFSCVLEETTNKVYMVDHNWATGNSYSMTVGLQNTVTTAIMASGSPNITIDTATASTAIANNDYYEFTPPMPMTYASSTTSGNSNNVILGKANQGIIGIEVVINGNTSPLNITNFNLNTTGTTNSSDISNARLFYTGTSDTFALTNQFGSTVAAPSGTYSVTGTQALSSGTNYFWLTYDINTTATINNYVDAQCTQISVGSSNYTPTITSPVGSRQIQKYVVVGTGTITNTGNAYPSPYANYYWGAKHQMLIHASELIAAGMSAGQINSLAFDVTNVNSCPALVNFEILLKNTNISAVSTSWESGMTTVYSNTLYQPVNGWITHTFSVPFIWDGVSNILVETCFNNNSWVNNGNASVRQTTTSFLSTHYYRADSSNVCSSTLNTATSLLRANMRFGLPQINPYDAGVSVIVEPSGIISTSTSIPVKFKIKNYGSSILTKASVNWQVNGITQTPLTWTGSQSYGTTTSAITAGNKAFPIGSNTIKMWTTYPNDSVDQNNNNDTMLATFYNCIAPLNGTYTIGGATSNFKTFNHAVNSVISCGISGPVVFNVYPGTYTEQIQIPEFIGSSSTNSLTFQSLNGDSSSVILTYSPVGTVDNYTISLDGADYITFKKITIASTGSSYNRVILVSDSATNNNFLNNQIIGIQVSANSSYNALVCSPYNSTSIDNNNIFNSNYFINGSYGLYWGGYNSTHLESGTQVINNVFNNQYYRAIYLIYQNAPVIMGNFIESNLNSVFRGIYCHTCNNNLKIEKNKITLPLGQACIFLYNSNGSASNQSLISNNFIQINTGGTCYGIYMNNADYQRFYNNSVNITGSGTSSRSLYINNTSSNNDFKNNIFANNASGYAIYSAAAATNFTNNYNNIYTNSSAFTYLGGNINSLTAWKTATSDGANSVSINPMYFSSTDLHIGNPAMNNLGTPINIVTDDIDGELRNSTSPDIGADEFTLYSKDLGVVEYVYSASGACYSSSETVTIRVKNYGTASINFSQDSALLYVSATGINPTTFPPFSINAGYFSPGATADIVVASNYNMSAIGTYTFNAYTVFSGDSNASNDAMPPQNVINTVVTSYPVFENIETYIVGDPGIFSNGWISSSSGSYHWRVDNSTTPSANTGPTVDHTYGTAQGKYVFTEASSPGILGETASFLSPCINFNNFPSAVLKFWYHMFGDSIGSLHLDVYSNGSWTNNLWNKIGPQQTATTSPWVSATIDLSSFLGIGKIRFRAIRGNYWTGDIAIDDILISSYPDVNFGADTNICSGNSILLDAGSGTGYSYIWKQLGSSTVLTTSQILNVSNAGTFYVVVADPYNFTGSDTITIGINSLPSVSFSGLPSSCCENASSFVLSGNPAGGVFSGSGISGITFNPSTAGTGTHTITYTYTNSLGCSNFQTQNITVYPLPVVSFSGLASSYCVNSSAVTLTGTPSGGTFSGAGISGNIFNPAVAGTGTYNITYTSPSNSNGCSNSQIQSVVVNSLPVVSFSGLAASYCVNASPVTLTGIPAGGVFSGNGISGNTFTPANAGTGTHSITYTYTNSNNCSNTHSQNVIINALPIVSAGADTSIYQNTSKTLSGSASGGSGQYSYSWSPAYLFVNANVQNPTTVNLTTTTIFTLTVTDLVYGCQNTSQVTITVTGGTLSLTCQATPNVICFGGTSQLNALASGGSGIYTYSWTSIPSGFISTMQNPVVSPMSTTTYICVINDGSSNTSSSATIAVNSLPNVNISGLSSNYCTGDPAVVITGTPGGGTFIGPGIIGNTFNPSIASTGNYDIVYTYTDVNGCSNSDTSNLTVNLTPTANAGANIIINCGSSGQSIGSAPQTGYTYSWTPTAGLSNPYISNPIASPAITTLYTLTVTNTNGGCSSTDDVLVTVLGGPTAVVTPDTTICKGSMLILTASGGTSYLWNTSDITPSISVSPLITTTYIVTVTDGGCSDIDSVVVTVTSPSVDLGPDTIICADIGYPFPIGYIVLDAGPGFKSYLWSSGDTTQTFLVNGQNYTLMTTETFYVLVTDSLDCQGVDSVDVFMDICGGVLENTNLISLEVFPNPSKGLFNLTVKGLINNDFELCIMNLQGQKIYCEKIENINSLVYKKQLDLSTYPKGVYFIKLINDDFVKVDKIIIQ